MFVFEIIAPGYLFTRN